MTQPLSSPNNTTGAPSFWTFDEHERLVHGLRLYPDGPYDQIADYIGTKYVSEVKNYAIECWKSKNYPSKHQQAAHEAPVKKHRARKWLRATLKWCIDALSFRCLRRQERTAYGHTPVRSSRHVPVSSEEVDYQPLAQEGVDDAVYSTAAPFIRRNRTDSELEVESEALEHPDSVADAWDDGFSSVLLHRQSQSTRTSEPFGLAPSSIPPARNTEFCSYASTYELYAPMEQRALRPQLKRALKRAAPEPAILPAPAPDTPKNQGPWSNDEHERFCAGLERYRYGSWKFIAEHVGTRTERQVMSHAQSIRAKRKRADEREKRDQLGHTSSAAHKSARTRTASVSSTPDAISHAKARKLTPVELLLASLDNPRPATSCLGPTKETFSTTAVDYSDAVAANLSPTLAGVFNFELSTDEQAHEDHSQVPLTTEDCLMLYTDLDFGVCSPPLDILVEIVFSDEELFKLLDITSTLSEVPAAT
ncbi:hypothetical protein JG687_00003146 [Phytophthora cactorum]|uniref:Myb domain n=1 Tax=Phytophthora cactorum TaxID=29920 RepID=A0A8T1UWF8_9STRA|nr:hypothetical protein PC121_g2415 [Phytophthora cactorum]KAG6969570.1 hypothetical protein JG687_00003146 [Phytophthora cactorum]